MRTNIVIDDEVIKEAMTLGKIKTKKEAVEAGIEVFVKIKLNSKNNPEAFEES
jgi:Arc/MetJ family transcription regulator